MRRNAAKFCHCECNKIILNFDATLRRGISPHRTALTGSPCTYSRLLVDEGDEGFAIRDVRQVFPGPRPPKHITTRPTSVLALIERELIIGIIQLIWGYEKGRKACFAQGTNQHTSDEVRFRLATISYTPFVAITPN